MLKHTPGPWWAGYGTSASAIESTLSVWPATIENGGFGSVICKVSPHSQMTDTDRANAHLIAASPDLKAVAEAYEQWEADIIGDNACWEPQGMATSPTIISKHWSRLMEIQALRNAALAKARSEEEVADE